MTQVLVRSRGRTTAIALICLSLLGAAGLSDAAVAEAVSHAPPEVMRFGLFMSMFGLSGYMLVISALVVIGSGVAQHRGLRRAFGVPLRLLTERAAFFFVAIAISGILAQVIKHIVGRARPKLILEGGAYSFDPLSAKASLASFPSGHATTVFAAALALSYIAPRMRVPLFVIAGVISVARVLAGAHYPSDVVAGALLGLGVTLWMARVFAGRNLAFSSAASGIRPKSDTGLAAAPHRASVVA